MPRNNHIFSFHFKKGDVVKAAHLEALKLAVEGLENPGGPDAPEAPLLIEWVRLTGNFGATGGASYAAQSGVVQYLNPSTNQWQDTNPAINVSVVTDPTQTLQMAINTVIPCLAHWSSNYIPLSAPGAMICQANATIPAISGSTPGYGAATLYSFNGTSLSTVSGSVTIFNLGSQTVASGVWLVCVNVMGYWFVIYEVCSGG